MLLPGSTHYMYYHTVLQLGLKKNPSTNLTFSAIQVSFPIDEHYGKLANASILSRKVDLPSVESHQDSDLTMLQAHRPRRASQPAPPSPINKILRKVFLAEAADTA
eukprot:scpid67928/ scgid26206/ 